MPPRPAIANFSLRFDQIAGACPLPNPEPFKLATLITTIAPPHGLQIITKLLQFNCSFATQEFLNPDSYPVHVAKAQLLKRSTK